jgi:CDP-diacylglycerol--serine O-phosphatidyltransferase
MANKPSGSGKKKQGASSAATPLAEKRHPAKSDRSTVIQEFSFARLIPNLATVAALCMGLSAIRFAMQGRFTEAVLAILIAGFLDGIDGRLARLLKVTSDFGAELDSLADFISFGVSPAIVTYLLALHHLGGLGWGITLFYSACMALRLARFNAMNIQAKIDADETLKQSPIIKAGSSKFFVGVPAPAAAFIALLPLMAHLAFDIHWVLSPYVYLVIIVSAGFLMISRLPTYSFKSMKINRRWVIPSLVFAAVLVATLVSIPWVIATLLVLIYLITIPFSVIDYKKMKAQERSASTAA